jgi:pseudaminic acid biosynthesis-associated methylase
MSEAQLEAWRGAFGDAYIERNAVSTAVLRARTAMWAEILRSIPGASLETIAEIGANIGYNLRALRLLTAARFIAVEPNAEARRRLVADGVAAEGDVIDAAAQSLPLPAGGADLAFTSGVLIHIAPDDLGAACDEIFRISRRYVACIEYFADKPEAIVYQGRSDLLFKRDFGAFWLDRFPQLRVIDYGFFWKRITGLDNLTWWLFEKGA